MEKQRQSTPEMNKLAELVKDARIAMMTTAEPNGSLRSRPLATLQMDKDGTLWFFTSVTSPKVEEIDQHRQVNLSYANPDRVDYVSISGRARIVRDREKMKQLWTSWVEPWFPKGLNDPDLALLAVQVDQAEYWDAPDSKVKRIFGLAKAMTTGDTSALGRNEKVTRTPRTTH
jgi:general stress protein 26